MKNFKADNENYVNEKGTSFLRLSLKKPKDWKWSLTTSSSSPEVAVPDIQLVDEDGCLLVDTSKQKPDYFLDRYRNGKAASFSAKYTQTPEPKIYPTRKSRSETPQLQNVVRKVEEDTQDKGTVKKRYWNWFNKNSSELVSDKNYCHYKDVESKKKEISLIKSSPVPKLPVEFARRVLLTKDITGKHITSPKPEIRSIYKSTSSYDCSRKPREPYPKQVSFSFNQKSNFNEETCSYYEQRRYNKKSPSDTNSKLKISAKEDNRKDFYKQKQKIFETNCNNQDQDKEIKKNSFCSRYFRKKNDVISSNFGTNVSSSEENVSMNIYENLNFQSCSDFSTCIYNCNPIKKSESYRNFKSPTDKLRKNYFSTHQSRSRSSSDTHIIGSKEQSSSGRSRDNSRRRRRVRSRQHSESLCSSSSSDHETIRTPRGRRRKNKSQIMKYAKGDRLVEVDGQSVRCPETARELLRTSSEVVRLQLLRHGLNGHRLEEEEKEAMGSNLSRHSGKGLTGRRSQSSGNLCNGKVLTPGVGRFFSPCGRGGNDSVGPRDRYKFCGSLPNHLDAKDPVPEDDCSYRNNNNEPLKNKKSDLELRLHPLAKGDQDQGYASERSPEDLPPPPPPPPSQLLPESCPLVTPENTFTVSLVKGSRGLGLSLTGGMDSDGQWPGLVRIKRLFPHQPAWECGLLKQGDILLTANNTPLTGLTNYEALEVLRTTPSDVVLTVCRPPGEIIPPPEVTTSAPPPPRRDPSSTSHLSLPLKQEDSFGEFEVVMTKVNGSLGFTLRKEDESVLGHYVRALVREPALSDGRIKPGDKIVAVNDVDMSRLTHEEAVMFLRQCGQEVKLRLYRDRAQTPVCALSPVQSHSNLHHSHKPILRKEAQDMLSDLAVKKSQSPGDSGASSNCRLGRSSSPRKRRIIKTPSPDSKPDGLLIEENLSLVPCVDRVQRPDTLNLSGDCRPHFRISSGETDSKSSVEADKMMSNEPLSMPPLSEPVSMPPLLTSSSGGFSYRNPAYRSANPTAAAKPKNSLSEELPDCSYSDQDLLGGSMQDNKNPVEGTKGLLKWKGVVFSPEEGTKNSSPDDSISQITECDASGNQILVVELNRGWNSRLGFSLQSIGQNTVISAIYPDSVASRDGRLHPGDQLIMVNDESVEGMNTSEVIDLLRKIRGSICITVWRKNAMLTSASSTAATISAYTNISSSSSSSSSSSATTQVHQQPEKQDNRK